MAYSTKLLLSELPFRTLNNFELECIFQSDRTEIISRFDNNVLLKYLKNHSTTDFGYLEEIKCRYFTEEEFNVETRKFGNNLSTFHLNIRKLGLHGNELLAFLSILNLEFDIIILTEVGKNSEKFIESLFSCKGYTPFYDLPLENNYGGVALFVKTDLNPVKMSDFKMKKTCNCDDCSFENVWIECTKNDLKSIVSGIYRHPGGNVSHFNVDMDNCLSRSRNYKNAIWGGDVNIDILQQEPGSVDYCTTLASYNMLPYITRPTRITNHSATLIDHLFVRLEKTDRSVCSGNFFCCISDHLPNFVVIETGKPDYSKITRPKVRLFSEKNMLKFAGMNYDTDWITHFETYDDIDEVCDFYMYNLKRYFNDCFPLVKVSRKKAKDKPWITPGVKKCIIKKNKLLVDKLNNPSPQKLLRIEQYKKIVDELIVNVKLKYYQDVFNNKKNSVKLLWDEFGPILGKKGAKCKNSIVKLIVNKKTLTDSSDIANAMNKHFAEIGPKLASKIESGINFKDYLGDSSQHSFFLKAVDETDVLNELLKLNHRKSAGPDELSPKLIKMCSHSMYKPLTYLFNMSIATGKYPKCFKIAKIVPLYKADKHCNPSNYRPISLLNCFDKIFEKLINRQLKEYLKRNNLLYKYQYAFREGYSTDLALLEFNDYVKKEIDMGNFVLTLFIDLKKAFDTVNHLIMLSKLEHYGIRGHCNKFFASYLENRKQYVYCNNVNSSILDMLCGVPQGSVLGPTLFLIYVNDMINCIQHSKLQLFADDTITSVSGKNLNVLFEWLKLELKSLMMWFRANKLSLNFDKTFYSIFRSIKSTVPACYDSINVNGETIKRKRSAKYLGLTFDEVLSWRHHVEKLLSELSRYFYLFYNLRKVLPHKFKLQLFSSYVYSRVSYGLHCYGVARDCIVNPVKVICNKLLKILLLKDRRYPTNDLFKECKMLKFDDLKNVTACKFVHKSVYPDAETPVQVKNHFTLNSRVHDRDVRDKLKVRVPYVKRVFTESSIRWYGAYFWNSIDINIRKITNLNLFKKCLKKSLLDKY